MKNQIFGVILLSLLILSSCAPSKEKPPEVVKVSRGDIFAGISATGIVTPRNRLEIKPPVAGRVDQIMVKEGESVKKGDILAWMSSTERAALLDAARAQGEESVKYWQQVYKPSPVVSPLNGFIIQRNVEPGQSFTLNDPILVMADRLIVKADVDETDLGRIKLGQEVQIILDAYPDKKIIGRVEHIAYESKVVNNVVIYEIDVQPLKVPDFFRSGMSATVNFMLAEKKKPWEVEGDGAGCDQKGCRRREDGGRVFVTKYWRPWNKDAVAEQF